MQGKGARRLLATSLLVLLAVSWSARGHCPMPAQASEATPTPHACHEPAQGVKSQAPPCCHAGLAVDPPATTKRLAGELAVAAAEGAWMAIPPARPLHAAHLRVPRADGSGPPVLPLRI